MKNDLLTYISDAHKDAYGVRPSLRQYNDMSIDELERECENLSNIIGQQIDDEKRIQAENIEQFENKVRELVSIGARTRETAIMWLVDAEQDVFCNHDPDHFCYLNGLPYGYLKYDLCGKSSLDALI